MPAINSRRVDRHKTDRANNVAAVKLRRSSALLKGWHMVRNPACLWDEWKSPETGERLKSCTMAVGEPNDMAAQTHDRMPVFLTEGQFAPWLGGEAGAGILKPVPDDFLQRWPVSKRVNSSKADADDAMLIEPVQVAAA